MNFCYYEGLECNDKCFEIENEVCCKNCPDLLKCPDPCAGTNI